MEISLKRACVAVLFVSATAVAAPFESIKTITQREFYQNNNNDGEKSLVRNPDSLLMEFGTELLTQNYIFGGVVTAVADPTHEDMGNLKASKFPTLMSRLSLDAAHQVLNILACIQNCQDPASYLVAYQIPVLKTDTVTNRITVDFSKISDELDIVGYWTQAMGMKEQHQKVGSRINLVEHSTDAVVFEIESAYHRNLAAGAYDYTVKTRWFLKMAAAFNPAFVSRFPTEGIGFFQTTPNVPPVKITRYGLDKPVHFYIKNVPPQYRRAFADALEEWNQKMAPSLHKKVIDYEFLEKADPRYASVVTGDIRYSVIEWDLDNIATYGGLGPSVAHPVTGETFSSVVWIQGPTIERMYKAWFGTQSRMMDQKKLGNEKAAQDILAKFYRSLPATKQFKVQGKDETFDFPALRPELWDPLFSRDDFDAPPQGYDYDKYMYGYFREMVSHEVGHNLGLRHNFRGNLGSDNSMREGTMSSSVMEYLGRPFRYLDRIGPYDVMAINYGYLGTAPTHLDWFCTDEDQFSSTNPNNSPECTSSDATNDPYAYQETTLQRVYQDLVAPGSPTNSTWNMVDLQGTMKRAVDGIVGYAVSAPYTANKWTNFSRGGQRPSNSTQIQDYVLSRLQARLCPQNEAAFISQKSTPDEQNKTKQKITQYRQVAMAILAQYKNSPLISSTTQLNCLAQPIP